MLHWVIRSLLAQQPRAEKVVLWLNDKDNANLPNGLAQLQSERFEIHYHPDTDSYRKLLPSLQAWPDKIVVTCDDDMLYPTNWLNNLYQQHLRTPNSVVAHAGRLLRRSQGQLLPYRQWPFVKQGHNVAELLPIGFAGVLYPVGVFSSQMFDRQIYQQLCPKADDLWFKAQAYLQGVSSQTTDTPWVKPLPLWSTQAQSLKKSNIGEDANQRQWQALCDYFPALQALGEPK